MDDNTLIIDGGLRPSTDRLNVGESGLAARLFTPIAALGSESMTIDGEGTLKHRPMAMMVNPLRDLGVKVRDGGGRLPIEVKGPIVGGRIVVDGSISSQFITGLLIALPMAKSDTTVEVHNAVSTPYIDMTLDTLERFGVEVMHNEGDYTEFYIEGNQEYKPVDYTIESDWSAASYWYEIVALSEDAEAEVVLPGLFAESYQGDSAVARLFEALGVSTCYDEEHHRVTLRKNGLRAEHMEYDFVDQPDLAQTFVVTCAMLGVPFRFTGLQSLKIKETDRMAALMYEMKKLGYLLREEEGRVLEWRGERCEPEADVAIDTYEDHRMAMAFAPAVLTWQGNYPIRI